MLRQTPNLARVFTKPLAPQRSFSSSPAARGATITLVGRLGAAPEIFTSSTGQEMLRYVLATSTGSADKRQTSWWRVACFAEGAAREFRQGIPKGSLVYVQGEARMRQFEKDGKTESALSITETKLELLSRSLKDENVPDEAA